MAWAKEVEVERVSVERLPSDGTEGEKVSVELV